MMVIFPHVPKVGGTTILKQLRESGLKVYVDYDAPPTVHTWHRQQCERRNAEARLLDFSAFDVVFGHFPIARYDVDRGYTYAALTRDPYKRAVSDLNFMFRFEGRNPEHPATSDEKGKPLEASAGHKRQLEGVTGNSASVLGRLKSGELPIDKFLNGSGRARYYKLYLDYWPRERFGLIGDMSDYAGFLQRLGDLLGVELSAGVVERKGDQHLTIDPEQEERIRYLLREDYAWYDKFHEVGP
jgi:hypothetical protein